MGLMHCKGKAVALRRYFTGFAKCLSSCCKLGSTSRGLVNSCNHHACMTDKQAEQVHTATAHPPAAAGAAPPRAEMLDVLMMQPAVPAAFIARIACLVPSNTPVRLICTVLSNSATPIVSTGPTPPTTPAKQAY